MICSIFATILDQKSFKRQYLITPFPLVDYLFSSRAIHDQSVELFEIARTVDFGWVNITQLNSVVSGPKFTNFLPSNVGGVVLDHLLFSFVIA